MDNIALPSTLVLVWDIKRSIEKNISLQVGIGVFVKRELKDEFAINFKTWFLNKDQRNTIEAKQFNSFHKAVVTVLNYGLNGQPIYDQIKAIETEIIEQCDTCIQEHVAKLPLIMQIPLLFLIFPAICILLLVPTLYQLNF